MKEDRDTQSHEKYMMVTIIVKQDWRLTWEQHIGSHKCVHSYRVATLEAPLWSIRTM